MKKVAILTTFGEATSGYSLITVAETQLRMLLDHGYSPIVLVQENFKEPDEVGTLWTRAMIDIRPCVPFLHLVNVPGGDFEERVAAILAALRANLADAEVCITHDIIFQEWYHEHNVAVRRYAKERPDLLWLHWIHSCATQPRVEDYPRNCRSTPPPGYIVYPNSVDLPMVCRAYGLAGQEWRAVACRAGHAIDPLLSWHYSKLTKDLSRAADLLNGEIVAIYPSHMSRAKQPDKIIRLMVGILKAGYEPRLLILDWQSQGKEFLAYEDELAKLAESLGLAGKVNFASRLDDRCSQGAPHRVIMELLNLSNVYIHPSRNETYALPVHEAILSGCLVVLNHDLLVMHELYGDAAIYMDFGSIHVDRKYAPDEQAFWNDEARRLITELRSNRALWAKTQARRWTPQALFRDFEPLLYLQPVGEG